MALIKLVVELIVSVVAILLIITLLFPDLMTGLLEGSPLKGEPMVNFIDEPIIESYVISADDDTREYVYKVVFKGIVEHTGELSYLARPLTNIYVLPVIDFKGGSERAEVNTVNRKTFEIGSEMDQRQFEGIFEAEIYSHIPPTKVIKDSQGDQTDKYVGEMEKDESILLESESGNKLRLTLIDVKRYELPSILGLVDSEPCQATFFIGCGEVKTVKLKQMNDCGDNTYDCERSIVMCNGGVHIQVNTDGIDCGKKTAEVTIDFTGGTDYDVGDNVGISFWIQARDGASIQCVDYNTKYEALWSNCGKNEFLGRTTYKTLATQ